MVVMDAVEEHIMIKSNVDLALCFDDILLVPQRSSVVSRHSVNTSMIIGSGSRSITLNLPVIAAPMDTVCDRDMCMAMAQAGGLGILHRYMSYEDQVWKAKTLAENNIGFGVAIASNNGFLDQAQRLYDVGVRLLLVDTANGHGKYAIDAVSSLRDRFYDVHIMAGNVATADGFARLADAGADSVRVGIGGGSACTTRIVSGHGVPTLASIMDCDRWLEEFGARGIDTCSIIADGGIRNSGDMVKAFAAGAHAVMVGSMLAGTDESPGTVFINEQGQHVKAFRGMASREAQKDAVGNVSVAEGISTTIPYRGSVKTILNEIKGGLGSGCSYSGVHNVFELSNFAKYVRVTSATLAESVPHAM
jgi:IMP dehydrogenase